MKQNVLLAKTDALASSFGTITKEYIKFFKGSGGAFLGIRKTYVPKEGTVDEPTLKGYTHVQTTVKEKLDYLVSSQTPYIDALMSQERTNAAGNQVELKIGDLSFGFVTALELLRLKSILEKGDLKDMYSILPVRSDSKIWTKTSEEAYQGREVYETEKVIGIKKTTEKENYILPDPNIDKAKSYTPTMGVKTTVVELGDYTSQEFSGEMSQRERAAILTRRQELLVAVIAALKEVNDVEATQSELTSEKIFGFIHNGKF